MTTRQRLVAGGAILAALAVLGWLVDLSGSPAVPAAAEIYGSWVFDAEYSRQLIGQDARQIAAVERTYGGTLYVFAPGSLAIGTVAKPGQPRPCTVQGNPANAFLVSVGEGAERRELLFQRDATDGGSRIYLSAPGLVIPLRRLDAAGSGR